MRMMPVRIRMGGPRTKGFGGALEGMKLIG